MDSKNAMRINAMKTIEKKLQNLSKNDFDNLIYKIQKQEKNIFINPEEDLKLKKNLENLKRKLPTQDNIITLVEKDFAKIYSQELGKKTKLSVRGRMRLTNNNYLINEYGKLIGYKVKFTKRDARYGYTVMTKCPTPKGTLYLYNCFEDYYCIRSHFFDRFSQRAYQGTLSREKALEKILYALIDRSAVSKNVNNNQILLFLEKGMGIGRYIDLENGFLGELATYINYEQMNEKQMLAALHLVLEKEENGKSN